MPVRQREAKWVLASWHGRHSKSESLPLCLNSAMHENLGASLSSPSGRVLPQDPGGCCTLSEQQLATGLAVALGPPHGAVKGGGS